MAHFLDDVVSDIFTYYEAAYNNLNDVALELWWAGQELRFGVAKNKPAGLRLQNASGYLYDFIWNAYRSGGLHYSIHQAFELVRDNWPEDPSPPFNMGLLLSTMLEAEPSQIQGFVGITDAYRQSIWNKPFHKEFFAALAGGVE